MKHWLYLIALCLSIQAQANDRKYIFDTLQNGLVKLLSHDKKGYLVTANRLYHVNKGALELKESFGFTCNDACLFENGIALATDSGLFMYSLKDRKLKNLSLQTTGRQVNHVVQDATNRLWFSNPHEGAYVIENGKPYLKVQAPMIYDMAATPDSNVWVGTNLGLYKVPPSGGDPDRYAEEGIEGFELPDNIVERLYSDAASNVWALLPDEMAFIPGKNSNGDIPSYGYPGTAVNKIFSITKLPLSENTFLFSTLEGILYMKSMKGTEDSHIHSGEIHQTYKEKAYPIPDTQVERPIELGGDPIVYIHSEKEYTWFVTRKGAWSISTKKFLNRLKAIG